jgi:hypothetical protein
VWIPKSAKQIEDAARAGELGETPSFDAKADLPTKRRNADLATDVAAMSTDGGVLLYGVGEDDDEQPTIPAPLELAGVADRIGQIVATSIAEVPYIDVRDYPLEDDPSRGYVVIVVPQSSRAPHQVTVGKDFRFYGRGAKGNRQLTEGEVARLYERRQQWAIDGLAVLQETILAAPLPALSDQGFVHAFVRPVVPDQGMWDRAAEAEGGDQALRRELGAAPRQIVVIYAYEPSLGNVSGPWRRRGADAWRYSTWSDEQYEAWNQNHASSLAEVEINIDGRGRMFCGRATAKNQQGVPMVMEVVVAGNVAAFFAMMAKLYEAAGYFGQVDAGVAVTNIKGAASLRSSGSLAHLSYGADNFTRAARWSAAELGDYEQRARDLLGRFVQATSGLADYDPFKV